MQKQTNLQERKIQERKKALHQTVIPWNKEVSVEKNFLDEGRDLVKMGWKQPMMDLKENKTNFLLKIALPDVDEEDIQITAKDDMVRVKAEKKVQTAEKTKGHTIIDQQYVGFYRVVLFPEKINAEEITTSFFDGVLDIRIPKK